MNYTRQQLIDALCREYDYVIHDDYNPDKDLTPEEYRLAMECLSDEDLVAETGVDKEFTIDEFMEAYGD